MGGPKQQLKNLKDVRKTWKDKALIPTKTEWMSKEDQYGNNIGMNKKQTIKEQF